MIPSRKQCLNLLERYDLPETLLNHLFLTEKVAVFLAKHLEEQGGKVSIRLVSAGALLHDLDKTLTDYGEHGKLSEKLLREQGYDEVAPIALKHRITSVLKEQTSPKTWEEKIVYYADKIAEQTICSVEERIASLAKSRKQDEKTIVSCLEFIKEIEEEILSKAGISFNELEDLFQ